MRGKNNRRTPIEAIFFSLWWTTATAASPRINRLLFACPHVGAYDVAALRLRKVHVRVSSVVDHEETIAKTDHAPVVIHDARGLTRTTWARPRTVVLQATHHVIERLAVIREHVIELAERDVIHRVPGFASVEGKRKTAILTDPDSFWIFRIDPERMKINMGPARNRTKVLAAVY